MNILFVHRNFPAQFKYLAITLSNIPGNNVMFITNNDTVKIDGIKKYVYKTVGSVPDGCHPYLKTHEDAIIHAKAAATIALSIKNSKNKPDVIVTHPSGPGFFMKYVFPDVPVISYCEWFYNADGADIGFDGKMPDEDTRAKIRCSNSNFLIDLYTCDACICPTHWQKSQFPRAFHNKIKVIHDGIDTDSCAPDNNAKFFIKDKNLELSAKDEVITYGTRGMEPYRGFPQFMEAAEKILKNRPNAHVVIAGNDTVCYGAKLEQGTYKEHMLNKLDLDMNRVHFVGALSFAEYIKLLQISSVNVYLTYPYILSWSLLNAMSVGCCTVASNTPPVLEVMKDNYNGLLVDFFDVDAIAQKIEYALDNQDKMQEIRHNARQTVVNNYGLSKMLPEQINFINSLMVHK